MTTFRILCIFILFFSAGKNYAQSTDVVVYGATPAGIFAAIHAARQGNTVALVEEYPHIGGLMTGGLSFTDFLSIEALGGAFNEYRNRVLAYYAKKYGANSRQIRDSYQGVNAEPRVTLLIFHQRIEAEPNIRLYTRHRIHSATAQKDPNGNHRIQSASFRDLTANKNLSLAARVFIDATYEGDLAVAAGAEFRVGREGRSEYCERFAGHIFTEGGAILAGSTGEGDHKVQAYNFRLIMTDSAENRRMIEKPLSYRRETYLPIADVFASGKVKQVFTQSREGILRVQPLVNRKADINDIKNALVRMASLGQNYDYPNGTPELRSRIIEQHKEHVLGLIWFLQNDESLPGQVRAEASEWGLAKDEFADNDNFPYRLYIREARRIMGEVVFTEHNTYQAPNSIRSVLNSDAIAMGDYALNCHGVSAPGPVYAEKTEGDFGHVPQPFQIPYGVMLPRQFSNLIVPVAISSSHVGFCAIRLEPTWSALGQAAGLAASLSVNQGLDVNDVKVPEIQRLLVKNGAKIIYISDIDADSPYFEAAQYFGNRGFFHDLYALEEVNLVPLTIFKLQYRGPALYHHIEPEKVLDQALAVRWIAKMSAAQQGAASALFASKTWKRGEFLNALFQLDHP